MLHNDQLDNDQYINALEWMVNHLKDYEYFYWDILPQASTSVRLAYAKATGDSSVLERTYEDDDDEY